MFTRKRLYLLQPQTGNNPADLWEGKARHPGNVAQDGRVQKENRGGHAPRWGRSGNTPISNGHMPCDSFYASVRGSERQGGGGDLLWLRRGSGDMATGWTVPSPRWQVPGAVTRSAPLTRLATHENITAGVHGFKGA